MTPFEYECLRVTKPHLNLPKWKHLLPENVIWALCATEEQMISARTAKLIAREPGVVDRTTLTIKPDTQ